MIPLRDHNPTTTRPVLTISLIVANVLVFFTEPLTAGAAAQARFFYCKAAIPYEVISRHQLSATTTVCPGKNVWVSILLSMFLHGGLLHIAGNMLFLWVFGNNIEDRLGRGRFFAFYMIAGLAATYAQSAIAMAGQTGDPGLGTTAGTPMVGASGAVAGILGAYILLFPRARVTTLVFLFVFVSTMDISAWVLIGLWFVLQVFSGVASIGASASSGVAFFAHIGGFVAGMVLLAVLRPRRGPPAVPPPPFF
jgi:membrane associated rhomboid family serine protease